MKDVLIRKFQSEYEHEGPDGCSGQVIVDEVKKFVNNAKVTEANLNRLERRIRNHEKNNSGRSTQDTNDGTVVEEEGEEEENAAESEEGNLKEDDAVSVSNYSVVSHASSHLSRASSTHSLFGRKPKVPPTDSRDMTDYDWGRLDDYASFLHQRDLLRMQMQHKEMQDTIRQELSKQIQERQEEERQHMQENAWYIRNEMIDTKNWEDQEQRRLNTTKEKNMELKRGLDEQVEYERKRKEANTDADKKDEEETLQRCRQELDTMNRRDLARRENEKMTLSNLFHEVDERNRNAAVQKKEDKKTERREIRDFQKLLDDRAERLQKEKDGYVRHFICHNPERDAAILKCQHAAYNPSKEQARFVSQFREIDDFNAARDEKKRDKLGEMMRETQTYLMKQMAEKREKKNQLDMLERLRADLITQDISFYFDEEKQKTLQRRLQNLENRVQLQNQIRKKATSMPLCH